MPPTPGKPKTSFKTYEASTRLLAAVVATTGAKLDFVAIARHVGGEATKDAINHRLRPIKQLAKMQAACVKKGEDPGELPVEKGEIQKLFGESTPSGLEWQFRDIKALGKAQQEAVANKQNPATLSVGSTPSGGRGKGAAGTPGSRASKASGTAARTPTSRGGGKRKQPVPVESSDSLAENGDNDDSDNDDVQETPTKRPAAKRARTAASSTPSKNGNGNVSTPAKATPTPATTATTTPSIFGDGTAPVMQSTEAFYDAAQTTPRGPGTNGSANKHVATPATIKKEFISHVDPFVGAVGIDAFGDDDQYEDGEI